MTHGDWPKVKLGEVLTRNVDTVEIDPGRSYQQVTVRLWGKGVVPRGEIAGVELAGSRRFRVRAGQFIMSRIDARHGAFGLVPDELDGAVASNDFPSFVINTERLRPGFLRWLSRIPQFIALCEAASKGTTNRVRINEDRFLDMSIALPDPAEQDQIAARIDMIAAKHGEARQVRSEIEHEAQAMLRSAFARIVAGTPRRKLKEIAPLVRRSVTPVMGGEYPELGVRSFGRGTFHKPPLDFLSVGTKKLYAIEPGDLVFNNVFAWEGAIAVAQPDDAGRVGSHRFITRVPRSGVTTADYLCFYFLTDEGLDLIGQASPGGAGRNRTLGLKKLDEIEVPLPTYQKQLWFDGLQAKVREMLAAQQDSEAELEALLPAVLDKAFRGELSQPSVAPAVKRPAAMSQTPPFARYVLLLLEAWGQPVSRMALEAGLMFMLNDHIRTRLLKAETSLASKSGSRNLFTGLGELIENLRANKVIRKDVLALEPEQAQKLSKLSQADRRRAAEAVKAVEALGESRAREIIVSEVPDGELVTVS